MKSMKKLLKRITFPLAITGFIVTLCIIFLWNDVFVTIKSGERGVYFSRLLGGTNLKKTYGEGLHLKLPWDGLYRYNVRVQDNIQDLKVLTQDGMIVETSVSIRYQVMKDLIPQLHVTIGPEYFNNIILPALTSAVRQTIGSYRPDDIYSSARQVLQDKMMVEVVEEIARTPIIVHNIIVRKIKLPDNINSAIEEKLVAEQKYLKYKFILLAEQEEARRKEIEGQGIQKFQELVNANMTGSFLQYRGVRATEELAKSNNAKMVVIGGGKSGLPVILNTAESTSATSSDTKVVPNNKLNKQNKIKAASSHSVPNKEKVQKYTKSTKSLKPVGHKDILSYMKNLNETLLSPSQGVDQ